MTVVPAGPLHPEVVVQALASVIAVGVLAAALRRSVRDPEVVGAAACLAVLWAAPASLVVDALFVVLVAATWWAAGHRHRTAPAWVPAAVALAILAGSAPAVVGLRGAWVAVPASVLLAAGLDRLSRWLPSSWLAWALLGVAAGAWATLPDTEAPLALGVALAPGALLGLRSGRQAEPKRSVLAWSPLAAAWAWQLLEGGRGRATGVVGAAACLGLVAVLALGAGRGEAWRRALSRPALALLLAVHAAAVVVAARVAGLHPDLRSAIASAAADLAVAASAALGVLVWDRHRAHGGPAGLDHPAAGVF